MKIAETPFHPFDRTVLSSELPVLFTYPFCYTPHPLCLEAAEKVQHYLTSRTEWQKELAEGKMFGVLVVEGPKGTTGFLAAYSGILAGRNDHPYFVPAVYDLLDPDGFFKQEEAVISRLNSSIHQQEMSQEFLLAHQALKEIEEKATRSLAEERTRMKEAKERREERRRNPAFSPEEEEKLTAESRFLKAELKRHTRQWQEAVASRKERVQEMEHTIQALKQERKRRSADLQQALFTQFVLCNARGEEKNLLELFADSVPQTPPAGAGECAAPKLLQYAYRQGWKPLAMAEFWWGGSPRQEIREQGHFYPACQGKCGPILRFMLQGLRTEQSPLLLRIHHQAKTAEVEVIYEDEWIAVVHKPAGMLSVPGKEAVESVYSWARRRYPQADGPLLVHRLDMDTSGLLLIAKEKRIHQLLQAQFHHRTVKKCYVALLQGQVTPREGVITLPLAPDPLDRPRQRVDIQHGKPSVTRYEVVDYSDGKSRVRFYPLTGRTHQLRVHAAHPSGLHAPIVGDPLYGEAADRLYLHAQQICFTHPVSGVRCTYCKEADF